MTGRLSSPHKRPSTAARGGDASAAGKLAIGIFQQEVGLERISVIPLKSAATYAPSSFTGESVDLVEEDDGGSDGPRLPKHLHTSHNRKEGSRANFRRGHR